MWWFIKFALVISFIIGMAIAALPYLIALAAVITLIVLLIKLLKRKGVI
ncbi:hypothetical protein [Lactobacillus phage Bassarid]|nr:hypothetical protein [Lactobacillus phage Bassarid]